MKTIADTLGVARSSLPANTSVLARRRGRSAKPETELLAEIKKIIASLASRPTDIAECTR